MILKFQRTRSEAIFFTLSQSHQRTSVIIFSATIRSFATLFNKGEFPLGRQPITNKTQWQQQVSSHCHIEHLSRPFVLPFFLFSHELSGNDVLAVPFTRNCTEIIKNSQEFQGEFQAQQVQLAAAQLHALQRHTHRNRNTHTQARVDAHTHLPGAGATLISTEQP